MDKTEKQRFADRFNEALDGKGFPPKGKNRQKIVGSRYGVRQQSARSWLEGETLPNLDRCILIAKDLDVRFEWFMTGRGKKAFDPTASETGITGLGYQQALLIENFDDLIEEQRKILLDLAQELKRTNRKIFTEMRRQNRKPNKS